MQRKATRLAIVVLAVIGSPLLAQPAAFEVASIRPHPGAYSTVAISISGPRVTIAAYGLTGLIMTAYEVESYQISGGPAWMDSDRFDINAKAEGETAPSKEQLRQMLQRLLADRFHLQFHREKRQRPAYTLMLAKSGPKLKESRAADSSMSLRSGAVQTLELSKATMEQFAAQLSNSGLDNPVVDRTGLKGVYDIKLTWTPEYGGTPSSDPQTVTIFAALQDQLGLKLEPQQAPVEILVLDRVEKPSGN